MAAGRGPAGGGTASYCSKLTSRSRHTTHSEVCTSSSAGGADGLADSGSSSGAVGSRAPRTSSGGGFSSSVGTRERGARASPSDPNPKGLPPALPAPRGH